MSSSTVNTLQDLLKILDLHFTYGTVGNDVINTHTGHDIVYAAKGDDTINWTYADNKGTDLQTLDYLNGGDGKDTLTLKFTTTELQQLNLTPAAITSWYQLQIQKYPTQDIDFRKLNPNLKIITNNIEVLKINQIPSNSPPQGNVVIKGSLAQNQTLTADTHGITDQNGLGTFSYQWSYITSTGAAAIQGATASTYKLTQADVGKSLSVTVSYTDGGGTHESLSSSGTAAIANVNDAPTGAVTITGTAAQNQTLIANTSTIKDLDGLGTLSYQWSYASTTGGQPTPIANATSNQYHLTQADVGKSLLVTVSYTDGFGAHEVLSSTKTGSVANVNDAPTGSALIHSNQQDPATGHDIIQQGAILTADTSNIKDLDGLGTLSYQWSYASTTGGQPTIIPNATSSQYQLTQADVGKNLVVTVSYTDGFGTHEIVNSANTASVANINDAPTGNALIHSNEQDPATGHDIIQQGATLTADTSNIQDLDGLGALSYQWSYAATDSTPPVIIPNATSSQYQLTQADVGKGLYVTVSYTDGFGTHEVLNSTNTSTVTSLHVNSPPTGAVSIPTIIAPNDALPTDLAVGMKLDIISTSVQDADGLGPFTYQWSYSTSDDPTTLHVIPGATDQIYTLQSSDIGHFIFGSVLYTDGAGTNEIVTSNLKGPVTHNSSPTGDLAIHSSLQVSGADEFVAGATLTADTSNIQDTDGLGTFHYQWLSDNQPIPNAVGATYLLSANDAGNSISVSAHYIDGNGTTENLTSLASYVNSLPTGAVSIPTVIAPNDALPTDLAVGMKLEIISTSVQDADGLGPFTYQWSYATPDDPTTLHVIQGATDQFYTLQSSDIGHFIFGSVLYTDGAGTNESVTSNLKGPVVDNSTPTGDLAIHSSLQVSGADEFVVGATLTADTSNIQDADGLGTFHYQWLSDNQPIQNASDSTYTLTQNDLGNTISVLVHYIDGHGTTENLTSPLTAGIGEAPPPDAGGGTGGSGGSAGGTGTPPDTGGGTGGSGGSAGGAGTPPDTGGGTGGSGGSSGGTGAPPDTGGSGGSTGGTGTDTGIGAPPDTGGGTGAVTPTSNGAIFSNGNDTVDMNHVDYSQASSNPSFFQNLANSGDGDDVVTLPNKAAVTLPSDFAFSAGAGNDTVTVGDQSVKLIDGGSGNDTVVFGGKPADYTFTHLNNGNWAVSHPEVNGSTTQVELANIEHLQFTDPASSVTEVADVASDGLHFANGILIA